MKENEVGFLLSTIFLVDSPWKTSEWQAIKLIKGSFGECLCVLWLKKDFSNKIPK